MKRFFECKSCGYVIRSEEEPIFCPLCRSSMKEVSAANLNFSSIHCPECDKEFDFPSDKPPYKCAFCNYTFKNSPFRIQEERL